MSLAKKFFAFLTALSVVMMLAGPSARALTIEELQEQIAQLQEQLAQYQAQLEALQGGEGGEGTTGGTAYEGIPEGFRFEKNLKIGMYDQDVVYLKKVLDVEVPDHDPWTGTPYFGPKTKSAVIAFQEKYADDVLAPWGLTSGTGFVGSTTRAKLNELLEGAVPPTPTCSDYTTEEECTNAGCYWYEDACHEEPQPTPTCSDYTTEEECTNAGCYWYEDACHEEPAAGEGLTIALADDTPAAGYLLRDTGGDVAEVRADVAKFVFTNGDNQDVTVTTLKLKRTGISSDSDVSNVYLYDGDTKIAEYTSFTDQVVTFTDSDGLFTVPAGGSKEITVKVDVYPTNATVTSMVFGIESADYVVSNASSVNGDFPIRGNAMGVATVTDLGYVNISNYTTYPATVDPGVTEYELWRFSVQASDQDMAIEKIVLTMIGTIATDDVQNLKLEVGGETIAGPVNIGSDNKVVFDMTASPYTISKGQTKVFVLKGDVPTGTGRSFKFTIREAEDFVVKDTHYNVYTSPLVGGSAFSVVQPTSDAGTSINNGTLTITVCSDSPSGNVAQSATNVSLAKFCFKANGEDIKVSTLTIKVTESGNHALDNVKLYFDGSQVGTTYDVGSDTGATQAYNCGNAAIIPAGETKVFEVKADITYSDGTAIPANDTIKVEIVGSSSSATGQSSLTSITVSDASAYTLTVASGALSVAKNNAMADYTASYPTGVAGATEVKVASFVITAGAGEGVLVSQIKVGDDGDDTTYDFGDNFQNLKLMHGDTQLGLTIGSLSGASGADYTFNISPSIEIGAGEQYVVDVYADILTGASGFAASTISHATKNIGLEVVSVSATGVATGADRSWSGATDLHKLVIASTGTLTVTAVPAPSTPISGQLVMGSTENTFATFSFTAGAAEDVRVSQIIINDNSNFCGSLSNIKLVDATTGEQVGSTVAAFDSSCNATFNISWTVPAGTTQYLVVKADVNSSPNAVSGGSHVLRIVDNTKIKSYGVSSGEEITETVSGATSNTQYVYKTKVTVAKNASSPSGSAVAGADQEVLRFDVTADPAGLALLSSVALSISGSVDTTGSGNAYLYDASDLSTPLATESYKAVTFADMDGADGGNEYTFQVQDNATACDGIPVGATVRIYDTSASAYLSGTFVVSAVTGGDLDSEGDTDDCQITFASAPTTDLDNGDILYYRPLQPGSGKLYFGAHTVLTADVANGATTLSVNSLNGFALGDTVTVKGYDANGNLLSATGTIKSLSSNTITLDDPGVSLTATIDYDYLSDTANALANKHTSTAIVYSGTSTYGSVGDIIPAGSTITYVVKGDTTGATTGENLRVDIATDDDLVWSDASSWTIYDYTQTFPVTGGTLTY